MIEQISSTVVRPAFLFGVHRRRRPVRNAGVGFVFPAAIGLFRIELDVLALLRHRLLGLRVGVGQGICALGVGNVAGLRNDDGIRGGPKAPLEPKIPDGT